MHGLDPESRISNLESLSLCGGFQRLLNDFLYFLNFKRFCEKTAVVVFEKRARIRADGISCNKDNATCKMRAVFLYPVEQIPSAHLRHFKIAYDEIIFAHLDLLHGGPPVARSVNLQPQSLENLNEELENVFLVIDNKNTFAAHELLELQRLRRQIRRRPGFMPQMCDDGQLYDKCGAGSRIASGKDVPSMLLDHPVG